MKPYPLVSFLCVVLAFCLSGCGPKTPPRAQLEAIYQKHLGEDSRRQSMTASLVSLQVKPIQNTINPSDGTMVVLSGEAVYQVAEPLFETVPWPEQMTVASSQYSEASALLSRIDETRLRQLGPLPALPWHSATLVSQVSPGGSQGKVDLLFVAFPRGEAWEVKLESVTDSVPLKGRVAASFTNPTSDALKFNTAQFATYLEKAKKAAQESEQEYKDKLAATESLSAIFVCKFKDATIYYSVNGREAQLRNEGGWSLQRKASSACSVDRKTFRRLLHIKGESENPIEVAGPLLSVHGLIDFELIETETGWIARLLGNPNKQTDNVTLCTGEQAEKVKAELVSREKPNAERFAVDTWYTGTVTGVLYREKTPRVEVLWHVTSLRDNRIVIEEIDVENPRRKFMRKGELNTHTYVASKHVLVLDCLQDKDIIRRNEKQEFVLNDKDELVSVVHRTDDSFMPGLDLNKDKTRYTLRRIGADEVKEILDAAAAGRDTSMPSGTVRATTPESMPATGGDLVRIQVPSSIKWFPTGVRLLRGERVRIDAEGEIKVAGVALRFLKVSATPAGHPDLIKGEAPYLARDLPCNMLLGRVSAEGSIFPVGSHADFTAESDGELLLTVNCCDSQYPHNSGTWTAVIRH